MKKINRIDEFLLIFMKYTNNQIPYGLATDISKLLDISRERVRQRINKLNLLSSKSKELTNRYCIICKKVRPSYKSKYCTRECFRENLLKRALKKKCLICKKIFLIKSYQETNISPRKYCSIECAGIGRRK